MTTNEELAAVRAHEERYRFDPKAQPVLPELGMRTAVHAMASCMEARLRQFDVDRGREGWAETAPTVLMRALNEKARALRNLFNGKEPPDQANAATLAVDAANYAMMVAHNLGQLPTARRFVGIGEDERGPFAPPEPTVLRFRDDVLPGGHQLYGTKAATLAVADLVQRLRSDLAEAQATVRNQKVLLERGAGTSWHEFLSSKGVTHVVYGGSDAIMALQEITALVEGTVIVDYHGLRVAVTTEDVPAFKLRVAQEEDRREFVTTVTEAQSVDGNSVYGTAAGIAALQAKLQLLEEQSRRVQELEALEESRVAELRVSVARERRQEERVAELEKRCRRRDDDVDALKAEVLEARLALARCDGYLQRVHEDEGSAIGVGEAEALIQRVRSATRERGPHEGSRDEPAVLRALRDRGEPSKSWWQR